LNHKTLSTVNNLLETIINDRLKTASNKHDLLQLILTAEGTEAEDIIEGVPKKYWVRDQLKLFMFAGSDTSSNGLCWMAARLALHPDWQEKLHQEIDSICGEGTEPPNYHQVMEMKQLEAFIKETLRLNPVAPIMARDFATDEVAEVDGVVLPSGLSSMFDMSAMHRRPEYFSSPDEFRPERWLENQGPDCPTSDPEAFAPFSAGFRSCIGKHFAMLEMKTFLATLLRNHSIIAADPKQGLPDGDFSAAILVCVPQFPVQIVKRV
jgi:cytochrome P450